MRFGLRLCLAIVIPVALCSCGERIGTHQSLMSHPALAEMAQQWDKMFKVYSSNDVHAAEQALLTYRAWVDTAESKGLPYIRYDAARGLVDEKLFLIYSRMHSPKADVMFTNLVAHINRERVYSNVAPTNFTKESLSNAIEVFERQLTIGWKTNFPVTK